MAQLKKIAFAYGFGKDDARDARASAAIVRRQAVRDHALARNDAAHDLPAIVGTLVAHHAVI